MHIENDNSRLAFLKKVALGIVSVFGLGLVGTSIQKKLSISEGNFKTISGKEADDLIKNLHSSKLKQLKPAPPPKNNYIIG